MLHITSTDIQSGIANVVGPDGYNTGRLEFEGGEYLLEFKAAEWGTLAAGPYTVNVRGRNGATGAVTASLYNFEGDPEASISVDGLEHEIVTAIPGDNAQFHFTMAATGSVRVLVTTSAPGVTGEAYVSDGGSYFGYAAIVDGEATIYTRPLLPGDYTISVKPDGTFTGTITVVPTGLADQVIAGSVGTQEFVALTTPGQNFRLTFTGTASSVVGIDIADSDFESFSLYLVDSSGTVLISAYVSAEDEYIPGVELPATGTYEIWLVPDTGETGSASVTAVAE